MSLDLSLVPNSQSNPGQARTSARFQSQRMNAALLPGKPGNITPDCRQWVRLGVPPGGYQFTVVSFSTKATCLVNIYRD